MSKTNSMIWNYYETNQHNKIAECKLCEKQLSYRSTSANLKQHLKLMHGSQYMEFIKQEANLEKTRNTLPKRRNLPIWNYFDPNNIGDKLADCRLCKKTLSYKTTITNLKQHLKQKHLSSYNEFLQQGESVMVESFECLSTASESEGK